MSYEILKRKVCMNGTSLALNIPTEWAKNHKMSLGDSVAFVPRDGFALVIVTKGSKRVPQDAISQITSYIDRKVLKS